MDRHLKLKNAGGIATAFRDILARYSGIKPGVSLKVSRGLLYRNPSLVAGVLRCREQNFALFNEHLPASIDEAAKDGWTPFGLFLNGYILTNPEHSRMYDNQDVIIVFNHGTGQDLATYTVLFEDEIKNVNKIINMKREINVKNFDEALKKVDEFFHEDIVSNKKLRLLKKEDIVFKFSYGLVRRNPAFLDAISPYNERWAVPDTISKHFDDRWEYAGRYRDICVIVNKPDEVFYNDLAQVTVYDMRTDVDIAAYTFNFEEKRAAGHISGKQFHKEVQLSHTSVKDAVDDILKDICSTHRSFRDGGIDGFRIEVSHGLLKEDAFLNVLLGTGQWAKEFKEYCDTAYIRKAIGRFFGRFDGMPVYLGDDEDESLWVRFVREDGDKVYGTRHYTLKTNTDGGSVLRVSLLEMLRRYDALRGVGMDREEALKELLRD